MAERVVFNEIDPGIGINLRQDVNGVPGWTGKCTQCGWPMHRWNEQDAVRGAQHHVDGHDPVLIGGDTDALIR